MTGFDQELASELIQELGLFVQESEIYAAYPWESISLVMELDHQCSQFGYVYIANGDWTAMAPGFGSLDIAENLQQAMTIPGKDPWKKCLLQLIKSTGAIEIDFDYTGEKWILDMKDPKRFALSLKPAH